MTSVEKVELMDVSGVRDNGIKALLLLARSLRWNVMQKPHNPAVVTAHDGTQRRLPTDTSIRVGVFQGHLSAIIAHSEKFTPTIELMDHIIQVVKPNMEQVRRMRLALGESPQQHRDRMSAHDDAHYVDVTRPLAEHIEITDEQLKALEETQIKLEEAADMADRRAEFDQGEPDTFPDLGTPSGGDERHIVSTEPARARTASGWSYESKIATKRMWSDGTEDFVCAFCDYTNPSLQGIAGHWKWHVQRGEVEPAGPPPTARDEGHMFPPEEEGYTPTHKRVGSIRGATNIVLKIRELVGMDVDETQLAEANKRIEMLRAENTRLREENKHLADDWNALQDLIGRKKK